MNTYVSNTDDFMSVNNLKALMEIFAKFLTDRYSYDPHTNNVNLKGIIYETMKKIHTNNRYESLTKTDLNKVTLSIVKNVMKNKFLDSSVDRPRYNDKSNQKDVNLQMEMLTKSREPEQPIQNNLDMVDKIETAYSETEFLSTLKQLEEMRKDTRVTQPDLELSKVFEQNFVADQKELFNNDKIMGQSNSTTIEHLLTERKDFTIMPETKPELLKKYVIIDSRERDSNLYPDASEYVITIEDTIRNVFSVELIYALYHKNGTEFYVNLQIDEFSLDTISTNSATKKAFVQLPLTDYINEFNSNRTSAFKEFLQPIGKLGKLSIKFVQFDGGYHDIGEHLLKFEIKHYNTIGDFNVSENNNLNQYQNILQEEVFLAHDETESRNQELDNEDQIIRDHVNNIIEKIVSD